MRPKVVAFFRRLAAMNPFVVDLLFAVVISAASVAAELIIFSTHTRGQESWWGFALRPSDAPATTMTILINFVMAWRRRAPVTVLLLSCGGSLLYHAVGYDARMNIWVSLLGFYTVAAHRPAAVSLPCALPTVAVWWQASLLGPQEFAWPSIIQASIFTGVAWTFGNSTRMLIERNGRLAHLTEQLRRDQEDRARRAVTEERVRIARELHDVVAHHISVIMIQSGLARYVFESDPPTARTALTTIADTGSEVMGEMRRLLSVLRIDVDDNDDGDGDGDNYDPAPGLQRLEQLVERVRAAGVSVEVDITGSVRPLAPGIDLCAYRIVQECLTNVLKHAGPATARVFLHYAPAELALRVTDDGPVVTAASEGNGHGLIGMRERVKLYKGTITAGSRLSGGFEVVVTLPLSSTALDDHSPKPDGDPHT